MAGTMEVSCGVGDKCQVHTHVVKTMWILSFCCIKQKEESRKYRISPIRTNWVCYNCPTKKNITYPAFHQMEI